MIEPPSPIGKETLLRLMPVLQSLAECTTGIEALDKTDDLTDYELCLLAEFMAHQDYFRPVVVRSILTSALNSGMIQTLGFKRSDLATSRYWPISFSQQERFQNATRQPLQNFLQSRYGINEVREEISRIDSDDTE